jgi:hypothetical protein
LAGVSVGSSEQDFPLIYWHVFDIVGSPQVHPENHFPKEQTGGFAMVCSGGVMVPAHFACELFGLPRRCGAARPVRGISRNLSKGAFPKFPDIAASGRDFGNLLLGSCLKIAQTSLIVIPAKAGIQLFRGVLDPGLHRGDGVSEF